MFVCSGWPHFIFEDSEDAKGCSGDQCDHGRSHLVLPLVAAAVIVLLVCCASYVLTYPGSVLVFGRFARIVSRVAALYVSEVKEEAPQR